MVLGIYTWPMCGLPAQYIGDLRIDGALYDELELHNRVILPGVFA